VFTTVLSGIALEFSLMSAILFFSYNLIY